MAHERHMMDTNTHPGCAMLIAFQLQQRLHERISLLRHTYTVCLVTHHVLKQLSLLQWRLDQTAVPSVQTSYF